MDRMVATRIDGEAADVGSVEDGVVAIWAWQVEVSGEIVFKFQNPKIELKENNKIIRLQAKTVVPKDGDCRDKKMCEYTPETDKTSSRLTLLRRTMVRH